LQCSASHRQNHQRWSPQCFWKRRKFVTKFSI